MLPVGGIKEKVLAARRGRLPARDPAARTTRRTCASCPRAVREELEFVLAARIEDALAAAIPELAERLGAVGLA